MSSLKNLGDKLIEMQVKAMLKKKEMKEAVVKRMKGATAMEYVLIISIMAGVILVVWKLFGDAIADRMKTVSDEIAKPWEQENFGGYGGN